MAHTVPVGQVVPPANGRVLRPHMHLQMLEKIMVLMGRKGYQHAHRPRQGGVDQGVVAPRDQVGLLQGQGDLPYVYGANTVGFLRGPVE